MIGPVGLTEKRNQLVDFPYPMTKSALAVMTPKPTKQETNHLNAICLPFQPQVWLFFVIAIVTATVTLYGIDRIVTRMRRTNDNRDAGNELNRFKKCLLFIFGIILVQG